MKARVGIGGFVGVFFACCLSALASVDGPREQLELLAQHGIRSDTPELLAFLNRLQPSEKLQAEIAQLIKQLSDTEFNKREEAFKKLPTFGEAARRQLSEATKVDDPEVSWRAGKILKELNSEDESRRRAALTGSVLEVLKARRDPSAAPVILATVPLLNESHTRDVALQALWACVESSHADALRAALEHKSPHVRAAAIVGLEKAAGQQSLATISPLLKSELALVRLAAARALIDWQAHEAIKALIELTDNKDDDVAWQADALLHLKTGHQVEPAEGQTLGDAWKQWAKSKLATAKLDTVVADQRHDLSAGRNTLEESFARGQPKLAKGYGRFLYEADNGGPAKVADGRLRIDGSNPEGDQRLFITSQRMVGRDRWPDKLEIRARLTGEEGNNVGWHMGVSVGRVKVLFHPGYPNGAFRAEATDDHDYIFSNEDMPFTPTTGVMHEITIRVKKTKSGAEFDVTVDEGGDGGGTFNRKFTADAEQLGDYNRLGLERSGREGGGAIFDSVSIRLGR